MTSTEETVQRRQVRTLFEAARPAEMAVSVVGEVLLAVRRGRSGGPLATAAGRIGG